MRNLAWPFLGTYVKHRYRVRPERFAAQGKRPYLILYNHQTPFDQFFVGLSFRGPVYYLATEDIFSNGFVSSLLRWAVAPIPIKKQTLDLSAIKTVLRVAKEGGTIAVAPEGNRTYSGRTGHINPAIAGLARKTGLPIVLYRIEGGYGVQPRWSDCVRRGPIRSYVFRVIEPEEYAAWSDEQLFAEIESGLAVDECCDTGQFFSKRRAEYLERCVYVCPTCGLSMFESRGNVITCRTCGMRVEYGVDKRLSREGGAFPFTYVGEWYDFQNDFVRSLDPASYAAKPAFRDKVNLFEVILFKRKNRLRKGADLTLYGDRVVIDEGTERELVLPFSEVSAAAVLGRNKLDLYHGDRVYQFKGDKRFNALKYVNFYYHFKNAGGGDKDGKFLGL